MRGFQVDSHGSDWLQRSNAAGSRLGTSRLADVVDSRTGQLTDAVGEVGDVGSLHAQD